MYQIGIDIGGTNMKIGLVDDSLQIVGRKSIPFPLRPAEEVAMVLAEAVESLLQEQNIPNADLQHIGVVIPGSIDPTGSIVLDAHNLGFHHVPFRDILQAQFSGLPVYLANDADGAALAELGRGAFVGKKTAVLLTLGTGVGGGLILDGKLFTGGCRRGVELGHMLLVAGGEPCSCGNRGCVEAYCSATALIREAEKAVKNHPESLLSTSNIDAKFAIECAKAGDPTALSVFQRYVEYLGAACCSLLNLLDPEVIAIGGGVSHAGDFLFEPLRKIASDQCFFSTHGNIIPAQMGNDAGMIGAAMLGME